MQHIPLGIEPEQGLDAMFPTPVKMRQEIYKAMRNSALVRNTLDTADIAGVSAEDRYTMLSYHALVVLEIYYKKCLELTRLQPSPPFLMTATDMNKVPP